jgi:hypothetical protein
MSTKNEGPALAASGPDDSYLNSRKSTRLLAVVYPVPDRRRSCTWCGIPFQPRAEIDEYCDKCRGWIRAAAHHSIVASMLKAVAES